MKFLYSFFLFYPQSQKWRVIKPPLIVETTQTEGGFNTQGGFNKLNTTDGKSLQESLDEPALESAQ